MIGSLLAARPSPKFISWLGEQSADTQKALAEKWSETAGDPDIAHKHPTGAYARLKIVMDYAVSNYGYVY